MSNKSTSSVYEGSPHNRTESHMDPCLEAAFPNGPPGCRRDTRVCAEHLGISNTTVFVESSKTPSVGTLVVSAKEPIDSNRTRLGTASLEPEKAATNLSQHSRSFRLGQNAPVTSTSKSGFNNSFGSSSTGSPAGLGYSRYVQPDAHDDDLVVFLEEFEVSLHVYDLSAGLVNKFSTEITGQPGVEGMLHSALVIYGFEYFFEGGIQRTPAGLTRFGTNFRKEVVTTTDITLDVFEKWVQEATKQQFQLYHYKTTGHNCHHFVDSAIKFLTNGTVCAPAYLLENTRLLAESPIGRVSIPLFDRVTGGYQYILTKQIATHQRQRRHRAARLKFAMESSDAVEEPPSTTFTYRGRDVEASVLQILTRHDDMTDGFVIEATEKKTIIRISKLIAANQVFLDPTDTRVMISVLVQSLEQRENWGLSPMLDAWRTLSLNASFVGTAGYEKRLNFKLLLILKDFYILPVSCKLSVLRLCCNMCASPHGAILLTDSRRIGRVVSSIGGALMDTTHAMVAHCGASLACNIIIASTILCKGSFDRELRKRKHGRENPLRRLMTLIVYHLNLTLSEDTRVRLLLAIFHFCLAGRLACRVVGRQRVQVLWRTVYDRCMTEETKELLRMIQYLVFNLESDGSESDKLSHRDGEESEGDISDEEVEPFDGPEYEVVL